MIPEGNFFCSSSETARRFREAPLPPSGKDVGAGPDVVTASP